VLDAVDDPARLPGLLRNLAKVNAGGLASAATVAWAVATTSTEVALAGFYLAVAAALNEEEDTAREVLDQARQLDPDQSTGWITELAELGRHQPAVLPLIAVLAAPPPSNPDPADRDAGAGT
jgi:hypothetical protein